MKKLLFIISFMFIICACTDSKDTCKIKGYDCWSIIQDLNKYKVGLIKENGKDKYYNFALEKKGLSIIDDVPFDDGGNAEWLKLANGVEISREHNFIYQEEKGLIIAQEYYTVYDPRSQKKFIYDSEGNLISDPAKIANLKEEVLKEFPPITHPQEIISSETLPESLEELL